MAQLLIEESQVAQEAVALGKKPEAQAVQLITYPPSWAHSVHSVTTLPQVTHEELEAAKKVG